MLRAEQGRGGTHQPCSPEEDVFLVTVKGCSPGQAVEFRSSARLRSTGPGSGGGAGVVVVGDPRRPPAALRIADRGQGPVQGPC